MNKIDKQMAVFTAVENMQDWVSLPELLTYLGEDFAERSVRRWLNNLVGEGFVEKKGQKKATLYKMNPTPVLKALQRSLFTQQYTELLTYIKQPLYLRKPISYQKEWLEAYLPNETFYLSYAQRIILKEQGERSYHHAVAGTYARHIYNRLLIDLSYNSSRLEGNTYSLLDTEKLIIEGLSAEGKLDTEKIMILNHKEAIRYLIDNAEKITIDFQTICTLHYLLADGLLLPGRTGIMRDHSVKIGGSTYFPLDNKLQLEQILVKICSKAALINDPHEQSFFLLFHIAYLQAFEDVNKRTARLSANISLIKNNLVPLSFNDVSKDDYNTAMIISYELNDIHPLASLYCFSYQRTCEQYNAQVESLGFDKIRIIYRNKRREILKNIIVLQLTGEAIYHYIEQQTIISIPKIDQTSFIKTIQEDLDTLGPSRIAGLGITLDQLNTWQKLQK